jgi:hypothetical protein
VLRAQLTGEAGDDPASVGGRLADHLLDDAGGRDLLADHSVAGL